HEIPTPALLEVITLSVINDRRAQYRLLEEGNLDERASMIERELRRTRALINRARPQWDPEAPTGVTWN
ncbi:MAG TPA: hypothetical protein VG797_03910, partial [Phycisphaerales bacterium]|nr:hypothetical protein [Phycisphaerales bacterium]